MCEPAFENDLRARYSALTRRLIAHKKTITTMESCTAGLIAGLLTDTEGASAVLKGAYITYSNESKCRHGVPQTVIDTYGVYSVQTAAAMATACRKAYESTVGIGISGTFGNADPANPGSARGQIFFAIDFDGHIYTYTRTLAPQPNRFAYKLQAAKEVLDVLDVLIP